MVAGSGRSERSHTCCGGVVAHFTGQQVKAPFCQLPILLLCYKLHPKDRTCIPALQMYIQKIAAEKRKYMLCLCNEVAMET